VHSFPTANLIHLSHFHIPEERIKPKLILQVLPATEEITQAVSLSADRYKSILTDKFSGQLRANSKTPPSMNNEKCLGSFLNGSIHLFLSINKQ
jgi:hypothetical protein